MALRKSICLLAAIILISLIGSALAVAKTPRNIILIGWDGTQREHLKEMIARGEVPNLMALAKEGALVDIDITTGATDTKAGWTQILTGYTPEKTGVYSNRKYQPIPKGYTIFERLEKFFGSGNIATVAVIGKKGNVDADPQQEIPYERWRKQMQKKGKKIRAKTKIIEGDGNKFVYELTHVLIPGKPFFNAKQRMDVFINGLSLNERVGTLALACLDVFKDKRFFFFIHFAEPDHSGHRHGENSQEYTDAIKSDDEWTGKIIAKLKELGLYEDTLIYVTADHGFDEGKKSHRNAPHIFLATNDPEVKRNGDRADIAPTILKRFGMDLSKLNPKLDGLPLDKSALE
jgi:hypothetical protein